MEGKGLKNCHCDSVGLVVPDFVRLDQRYSERRENPFNTSTTTTADTTIHGARKRIIESVREGAVLQAKTLVEDYSQLRREQEELLRQYPLYTASDSLHLNRYRDVLPYAYNRVILKSGASNGYINASWVREAGMSYIACQGPLEETSESFWLMILEQEVSTVVMLTSLQEQGRNKCHGYFPQDVHSAVTFGSVQVTCVGIGEVLDGVIERDLEVIAVYHNGNRNLWSVKHYQLQAWPDHGVPDSPNAVYGILDVLYRVSHQNSSSIRPVVLHCSAGIGRTGVVIVLDILRSRLSQLLACQVSNANNAEQENAISTHVVSIVKDIRKQRAGMVQTLPQLKFCIDTLVDICDMILQRIM